MAWFKKMMSALSKTNEALDNTIDNLNGQIEEKLTGRRRHRRRRRHGESHVNTISGMIMEVDKETQYTEQELCEWLDSLPDYMRIKILNNTKQVIESGGDPVEFLRKVRIENELAEMEQQANAPKRTLIDVYWDWRMAGVYSDLFAGKYRIRD